MELAESKRSRDLAVAEQASQNTERAERHARASDEVDVTVLPLLPERREVGPFREYYEAVYEVQGGPRPGEPFVIQVTPRTPSLTAMLRAQMLTEKVSEVIEGTGRATCEVHTFGDHVRIHCYPRRTPQQKAARQLSELWRWIWDGATK